MWCNTGCVWFLFIEITDGINNNVNQATDLTPESVEQTLLEIEYTDPPVRIGFASYILNNQEGGDNEVLNRVLIPDIKFVKHLYHTLTTEGRQRYSQLIDGVGLGRDVRFALSCAVITDRAQYLLEEIEQGGLQLEEAELDSVIFDLWNNPVSVKGDK